MAAHSSAACSLCVLFLLLLSTATPSAAVSAPNSALCTMPSPAPDRLRAGEDDALPLLSSLDLNAGYFFGGQDLHFTKDDDSNATSSYSYIPRSFSLLPLHAFRTSDTAVFHVTAILTLSGGRDRQAHYVGSHPRRRHHYVGSHSVTFSFEGYYTTGTTSAELCLAGTGSYSDENGPTKRLRDVELHLRVPDPSSITDPFITGKLKGSGFETISLVAYAEDDTYSYGERASCSLSPPPSAAAERGALQALGGANVSCAHLKERLATSYKLQDARGGDARAPGASPERGLHISEVQCTARGADRFVRAYAAFSSNDTHTWRRRLQPRPPPPYMMKDGVVVAEGYWDSARSMLCLRACRVVGSEESMAVDKECDMGMSFWFPGVWTIRDRSAIAGMLWNSSKGADGTNDGSGGVSGVVSASSIDFSIHRGKFSEVKYEYTIVEQAKKHYLDDHELSKPKKKVTKGSSFVAPNYTDHDFEFRFYETKSMMFGGRAYPIAIGSATVYGDQLAADDSFSRHAVINMNSSQELLSVSYDIREQVPAAGWVRPKNGSYGIPLEERRMAAEGVFDPKTGILCLIACREYNSSTTDCQILITVYLASLDSQAQGHGRAAISSLRAKTDPLFFEKVDVMLFGMYSEQISESISRMDYESILLVISTTLPCVFAVLQIFHARRRPDAAAATSVTMLVVLALGYVAPLVVSSEALFLSRRRQFYVPLLPFQSYVPYELSQAMLRAPTLIALLLQLRLIQLALSARKADAEASPSSSSAPAAERRALWLCVPLYLMGGALTVIVHVVGALRAARAESSSLTVRVAPEPPTLWEDLVSSAGLAQDAFLLPQVIMNALSSPGVGGGRVGRAALSPWFYIGGTVVRAMPHVYDVVRAWGYVASSRPSYVYASPRYDRYGVVWDVVVPCAAALLAVLVFLQQRVGPVAPLFPASRRRLGEYQMVSPL